ncbi:uroporphyrinogen-III synthase [Porticoccus sp.]
MVPTQDPMRVLLVRPRQQDDEFIAGLVGKPVELYHCPVMEIVPLAEQLQVEAIKSSIHNFDRYQIAIFISRTAAYLGLDWLKSAWHVVPKGVRFYAVGKSTAWVLQQNHIPVETPLNTYDSEGLLNLPSLQNVTGKEVLIFAGKGGRRLLEDTLEQRGASVHRCDLYERCVTAKYALNIQALLSNDEVDVVVAHSGELLLCLFAVVAAEYHQKLLSLPLLVPGKRVAELAVEQGFRKLIIANSALPSDMVSAILEWYSDNG